MSRMRRMRRKRTRMKIEDREAGVWVLIWGFLENRARRMRTWRRRRTRMRRMRTTRTRRISTRRTRMRMRIGDREAGVWVLIWGFPGNRVLALLVATF